MELKPEPSLNVNPGSGSSPKKTNSALSGSLTLIPRMFMENMDDGRKEYYCWLSEPTNAVKLESEEDYILTYTYSNSLKYPLQA